MAKRELLKEAIKRKCDEFFVSLSLILISLLLNDNSNNYMNNNRSIIPYSRIGGIA